MLMFLVQEPHWEPLIYEDVGLLQEVEQSFFAWMSKLLVVWVTWRWRCVSDRTGNAVPMALFSQQTRERRGDWQKGFLPFWHSVLLYKGHWIDLLILLGWPRSLFGFFHHILQKNLKKLFGQPNIIEPWWEVFFHFIKVKNPLFHETKNIHLKKIDLVVP